MNSLKNLFGKSGKKNGYFMELAEDGKASNVAVKTDPLPQAAPTVEAEAPDTKPTPEQPAAKPAKVAKVKKLKKAEETVSEAAPQPVAVATIAPAPAKPAAPVVEGPKNFATDFLVYGSTPRRRPGPSLTSFLDMAGDMQFPGK